MTRIIAGAARGRRLRTPSGTGTRPTTDRVREALFSALESSLGSLAGLRVLDLYAGTGAVGLEALSRGAAAATLVESHRRTARLVQENADALGLPGADVVAAPAADVVARRPVAAYDVVYVDPPYDVPDAAVLEVLGALLEHGWLAPAATVVVERSARPGEPVWPEGFVRVRERTYGETVLWWLAETRQDAGSTSTMG